jgi:paraquat-inducible protein A
MSEVETNASSPVTACRICGLIQRLPPGPPGWRAYCCRCGKALGRRGRPWLSLAAAVFALAVAPAAFLLPVLRIEKLGLMHESSILGGIGALWQGDAVALAMIIAFFSLLLPLAKLTGLVVMLTPVLRQGLRCPVRRRWVYEGIELSSRWGMVDVLLVALLVAVLKLGDLVSVQPGPGVLAFALMVLGSMVAGLCIQPHDLWTDSEPTTDCG